jgi:hypothetical protein
VRERIICTVIRLSDMLREIKTHMKKLLLSLLLLTLSVAIAHAITTSKDIAITVTASAPGTGLEEFAGPLLGWKRAKGDYGCAGNGTTDDTACLQGAINAISSSNPVLYLEAGTYKISGTLNVVPSGSTGTVGQNIIGADPSTTTISWAGSAGGTMMTVGMNTSGGAAGFKIDRITFDGTNTAGTVVNESYGCSGLGGCIFDATNEYADDVFKNAAIGVQCGFNGLACADITFIRDTFENLTTYGIAPGNGNALDVDLIYSTFNNVHMGALTHGSGISGGINVIGSLFESNSAGDILMYWPTLQLIQGNFSTGSSQFLVSGGGLPIPAFAALFANTAVGLTNTSVPPIDIPNNSGWASVGNVVQSPVGGAVPVVEADPSPGDMFSAGNTFTLGSLSSPCTTSAPAYGSGHCHEFTTGSFPDQIVSRGSINTTPPTMPPTPPNNGPGGNNTRQIYEVGTCAAFEGANCHSTGSIAAAVTAAISGGSSRPVVHIPAGGYGVGGSAITVPACPNAGCDMQIVGDGWYTSVSGTGAAVFQLTGPSTAVIRDMYVAGNGSNDGILVTNADQSGARVFLNQPYCNNNGAGNNGNCLNLDGINNTVVEAHDFLPGVGTNTNGNGVTVSGTGTLNVFGGSAGGNWNLINMSGGANIYFLGVWNDNNGGGSDSGECSLVTASGGGNLTYAAALGALAPGTGCAAPAMSFNNFTGNAFLTGITLHNCGSANCNIAVTGNSTGSNILVQGMLGPPGVTN